MTYDFEALTDFFFEENDRADALYRSGDCAGALILLESCKEAAAAAKLALAHQ